MSVVTLRCEGHADKVFPLHNTTPQQPAGQLDYNAIKQYYLLRAVKLDGVVMGADNDGLTRNRFLPNSVVVVTGIKDPGGTSTGPFMDMSAVQTAAIAAAEAVGARIESKATAAVEAVGLRLENNLGETSTLLQDEVRSWHSSQSHDASRVTDSTVQLLRRLLKVRLEPFDDADPSLVLAPAARDGDFEWDDTPEPTQRTRYMEAIVNALPKRLAQLVAWVPQTKADIRVHGLRQRVVAKSDELLCAKKWKFVPDAGCLIGIELKKQLTQASRRQGEVEFYCFGLTSNFPFMQLVTDMQCGGLAYYKWRDEDGYQVVTERILPNMNSFYAFLGEALEGLPNDVTRTVGAVAIPVVLSPPERYKFTDPLVGLRAAASVFDEPDCGDDALDDLSSWFSKEQLHATELSDALKFADQPGA